MTTLDPSTGRPLPTDAIQRVLFVAPKVHIYNIPPLTSNKGYTASTWTADNNKRLIFTARLRIFETAFPAADGNEIVKAAIVLEDPATGDLFAAAPYSSESVVEQVLDSSRFFAVRVQGEGGRKAVLGVGFEDRSDAFDFGVSLQEARKVQGLEKQPLGLAGGNKPPISADKIPEKKDFSLKEGETITVNIGGKGRRAREDVTSPSSASSVSSTFSIAPPPSATNPDPRFSEASFVSSDNDGNQTPFLPPPPSAEDVKAERRRSRGKTPPPPGSMEDLGFDDGEFGEFQ
ncbi:MAG: hypothetical protein M1833_006905 [Piccolia ochrophora]|nr:MAG: hypothetical protein M1833_006905 [Piccolia ochrophora]